MVAALLVLAAVVHFAGPWSGSELDSERPPKSDAVTSNPEDSAPDWRGVHPRKAEGMGNLDDASSSRAPTLPESPELKPLAIVGTVLRLPTREPIEGAEVALRLADPRAPPNLVGEPLVRDWTTHSDEVGAFAFSFGAAPPVSAVIHVEAPGAATVDRLISLPADGEFGVEIEMDAGSTLSARVVDPDGNPIEGALVCAATEIDRSDQLMRRGSAGILAMIVEGGIPDDLKERIVVTDAEGRFTLPYLPGGPQRLCAAAKGFLPRTVLREAAGGGEDIVLHTVPGRRNLLPGAPAGPVLARVSGRILGVPREAVGILGTVSLRFLAGSGSTRSARVREDSYLLEGVPPGRYLLDHRSTAGSAVRLVEVPEGVTEVTLDLDLSLPAAIEGVVVDGSGKPVGGAVVRAFLWERVGNPDWAFSADPWVGDTNSRTDGAGRFRLEPLPPVPHLLSVGAPGFGFVNEGPFTPGAPGGARITLETGTGVTVRLLGWDGLPVRYAALGVFDSRGILVAEDAGDGMRLRGWGVAPGDYEVVAATPEGYFVREGGVRLEGATRTMDLRLEPAAALAITLDPGGGEVPGRGSVALHLPDGRGVPVATPDGRFATQPEVLSTDTEGQALREDLSPGTYRLRCRFPGGRVGEATAVVEPGRTAEVVIVVR